MTSPRAKDGSILGHGARDRRNGGLGLEMLPSFGRPLDSHHPERNSQRGSAERQEEGEERVGVRRRAGRWV